MKIEKGRSFGIALVLFIVACVWSLTTTADTRIEYAYPEMKEGAQALFDEHFAEYLNSMKSHYDTDGDLRQAELIDGVSVQQVSLEGHNFFVTGYEFPLQLEGKTVGTVMVEQNLMAGPDASEWKITDVSPIADLDYQLSEATRRFPSARAIRYIHDPNFRIRGFYAQTDTDTDGQFFDTYTQTVIPIEQLYGQIDARRLEPGFSPSEKALVPVIQVGAAGEDGGAWSRAFVVLVSAIAAIILGILGRVRKLRREQIELDFRSRQGIFLKECRGTSKENDAEEGEKTGQDARR